MNRKQLVTFILIAFFIGAIGSIAIGRFVIPYLATFPKLQSLNRLATNSPIIVNRREEVQLNEGVNLIDLVKQAGNITATIYSGNNGNYKFAGNGIIVSSDGLIFTTKQVGSSAGNLIVVLNDGTSFPATVGPADPRSDLMVIKIPAQNLSVAEFDEARSLQAGQRVIGIGPSTKEFNHKFTTGFVSKTISNTASLERVFLSQAFEESFDTDAAIRPEFFGGPMINLQGKVVGMMSNANSNILPAEDLQTALISYFANTKILRPNLGIKYLSLSKSLATLKGLQQAGALVLEVQAGTPAQKAGLLANDFIIELDGQNLQNSSLEYLLNRHSITDMKIKVLRAGNPVELTVKLEAI